ncbi:DUF4185 domain-containing protein [Solicola gregarius]|uniref:DUF4185 domain-containing protein n=1 Tax=Solicola gregarius TaxID=2908642 RepID=A0AA46TLA8_9ACTN|nr:DUF4185 domain-containing protein [Solicola gregarius]UYM07175.1 DUF4185 domain-containing protein [Solicola gregarius]
MALSRRAFLSTSTGLGLGAALGTTALPQGMLPSAGAAAVYKQTITGVGKDPDRRWRVVGTDLGIPYVLENGSIGYLFGDTFSSALPGGPDWRSPVMLRSASQPGSPGGIVFDNAAGVAGDGLAPEIMYNGHKTDDGAGTPEFTVIPNDGISFPETGDQIISYMSIREWYDQGVPRWRTNYAGIAHSTDSGNHFTRTPYVWWNNDANNDPFQMWTMQRGDDGYVYIFSVAPGRQVGPMMLRRVPWDAMFDQGAYQGWGYANGKWDWNNPCTPILEGSMGEPSVRKLQDGTWAMSYLREGDTAIVTRTAEGPDKPWSPEVVQVTFAQEPYLYGGFIHPWSNSGPGNLHLMVSKWTTEAYHVSQFVGML